MTLTHVAGALVIAGAMALPLVMHAREGDPAPAVAKQMPPMPKPGPEHAMFKEDAGTWDATVEVFAPGAPPMTSKGVETNRIGCGGLCLITDFKGEMMPGQPFEGHGIAAYDPQKKKYVGSWTDSASTGLAISEASWDPATKTMTGSMEAPDMTGRMTQMRTVGTYKGDTRTFTMYAKGPDGKEAPTMKITYTRKQKGS